MLFKLARPGDAHHVSQHERGDDRVVGEADDRDDVGNDVDRRREIGEERPYQPAGPALDVGISGEPPDESNRVGKQSNGAGELAPRGRAAKTKATNKSHATASAAATVRKVASTALS